MPVDYVANALVGLLIGLFVMGLFGWLIYRAIRPRKHDPLNRPQWYQRPQFFLFAILVLAVFAFLFTQ